MVVCNMTSIIGCWPLTNDWASAVCSPLIPQCTAVISVHQMFSPCVLCLLENVSQIKWKMLDVEEKHAGTRTEHTTLRQSSVELEFWPCIPGVLGMGLTQCCRRHTRTWRASTWRDARRECYSEVGGREREGPICQNPVRMHILHQPQNRRKLAE